MQLLLGASVHNFSPPHLPCHRTSRAVPKSGLPHARWSWSSWALKFNGWHPWPLKQADSNPWYLDVFWVCETMTLNKNNLAKWKMQKHCFWCFSFHIQSISSRSTKTINSHRPATAGPSVPGSWPSRNRRASAASCCSAKPGGLAQFHLADPSNCPTLLKIGNAVVNNFSLSTWVSHKI